jgi:hypothetical protein
MARGSVFVQPLDNNAQKATNAARGRTDLIEATLPDSSTLSEDDAGYPLERRPNGSVI